MNVLVYTKPGCDCCAKALRKLQTAAYDHDLTITARDISGDAGLMAKYGNLVPVVFFDGKLRFKMQVNEVLLKKVLANVPARV
ncbi:MAG: glutaredoxin family protein [Planctomycetes bacterium]|nr:glutaredoxin family protein [Planctomycetota bacterium]